MVDGMRGKTMRHSDDRPKEKVTDDAQEENHCRDCCCARSWKALGITKYTGLSIPEHIELLKVQLEAELKWRRENSDD